MLKKCFKKSSRAKENYLRPCESGFVYFNIYQM